MGTISCYSCYSGEEFLGFFVRSVSASAVLFIIYFGHKISLYSLGNPPTSAPGLWVCAMTPGFSFFYSVHKDNFCFQTLSVQGPAMFLEVVLVMISYRKQRLSS